MGGQGSKEEARLATGAVHLRDKMELSWVGRKFLFGSEGSFSQDVGVASGEALTESHGFSLDLTEVVYRAEKVEDTFHPLGGAGRGGKDERSCGGEGEGLEGADFEGSVVRGCCNAWLGERSRRF